MCILPCIYEFMYDHDDLNDHRNEIDKTIPVSNTYEYIHIYLVGMNMKFLLQIHYANCIKTRILNIIFECLFEIFVWKAENSNQIKSNQTKLHQIDEIVVAVVFHKFIFNCSNKQTEELKRFPKYCYSYLEND